MREKNIRRAAHALYQSQGDDKNKVLASMISDPEIAKRVEDQGRALIVLEKLLLPRGQFAYEEEEMRDIIYNTLTSRDHRIQDNDEEDDEIYAAEKRLWNESRHAKVSGVLGKTLDDLASGEKPSDPDIYPEFMKQWNDCGTPEGCGPSEEEILDIDPVAVEEIKLFSNAEIAASAALLFSAAVGAVTIGAWLLRR